MIKAKEFWNYVCNELNYRFFAGIPSMYFDFLYDTMSSDIMHYIPAVNEETAIAMVIGVEFTGFKGVVIANNNLFYFLNIIKFLNDYDLSLLCMAPYYEDTELFLKNNKIKYKVLNDLKRDISYIDRIHNKNKGLCVLLIKKEVFE